MSLWGNADSAAITGTVTATNDSATVAGSSTVFTTVGQIDVGDLMMIVDVPYRIKSIESATSLTLTGNYAGSTASGLTVLKRETPRNLSITDSDAIFGVDETEMTAGGDNVVSLAVNSAGTGYVDAADAAVTVSAPGSGTTATGTAVVTAGKVTSITITEDGAGYTSTPTVTIHGATASTFDASDAAVAVLASDTIVLTSAQVAALAVNDAVTYTDGGGTAIVGLTTDTVYYIHSKPSATTIKLKTSVNATDAIDLTAVGVGTSHTLTGATATASATLGSGTPATVTHSGWVKRTVGTGGRAGRITYETLVAMNTITGDTADDAEFSE
jgi:hypothetical protein